MDYGVWWRDEHRGVWRCTWVETTGELYALRLGVGQTIRTPRIMIMNVSGSGREGPLLVLGRILGREQAEAKLDGWAEVCGEPSSLYWIRDRVTE